MSKILLLICIIIELFVLFYIAHTYDTTSHNTALEELFTNISDEMNIQQEMSKTPNACILDIDNTQKLFDVPLFKNENEKNVCYTKVENVPDNVDCCPNTMYINNELVCRKDFNRMTLSDVDDWTSHCFKNNNNDLADAVLNPDKKNPVNCKSDNKDLDSLKTDIKYRETLIQNLNKKIISLNDTNNEKVKQHDTVIQEKLDLENEIKILKKELIDSQANITRLELQSSAFVDGMKGYKKFENATLSSKGKYILDVDKSVDTPDDCAELCNNNEVCQSFSFDNNSQLCKFYNVNSDTIPLNIYGKNIGNVDYYEKNDPIYNYKKYPSKTLNNKSREVVMNTEFPLDCSKLCDTRDWCKSFEYNKSKRECHLKDTVTDDTNPLIYNTLYDFYNVIDKQTDREKDTNVVAYWKLNEGFGSKIYDSTGNSIHGELLHGSFTDDKLINFDGKSTIIVLPGNKNLDVKKVTISMWIKTDDINRYGYLFEKTTNGYMNSQYSIFISRVNDSSAIVWRTNPSDTDVINDWTEHDLSIPVRDNLMNDTWCNIVVVHNGKEKKIYINGELKKKTAYKRKLRENENGISIIGAHGKPINMYYKGFIKNVRVYKKDLNDTEIQKIYSTGS